MSKILVKNPSCGVFRCAMRPWRSAPSLRPARHSRPGPRWTRPCGRACWRRWQPHSPVTHRTSRLLGEDAGLTATAAAEDVARAEQALLALPAQAPLSPVCALLPAVDDPAPFSDAVRRLAMALNAGSAVLLLSSPCVAAPLLALAELAARSGVPAGVFNLVHGDAMSARALQAAIGDSAG